LTEFHGVIEVKDKSMKKKQRKNNSVRLVVLNAKGEGIEISQPQDSNSIQRERLRQSKIKFNLASILIALSASFCFTGVALFWTGIITEETAIRTVDIVSRVVSSYCLPLMNSSQGQLEESADAQENDK
jgi:hypothetical protein